MVVTVKPTACRARSADSRPEPGPWTSTSSVFMPCSIAFLPASSAATWAAYGVDLREPLKPIVPADDQEIVLPCASVIVMIVLLNDAFTWATPDAMFLRSRFLTRSPPPLELDDEGEGDAAGVASRAMIYLTASCRRWPSRGPCACVRWYGCAGRGPAGPCGDAGRDSSR